VTVTVTGTGTGGGMGAGAGAGTPGKRLNLTRVKLHIGGMLTAAAAAANRQVAITRLSRRTKETSSRRFAEHDADRGCPANGCYDSSQAGKH